MVAVPPGADLWLELRPGPLRILPGIAPRAVPYIDPALSEALATELAAADADPTRRAEILARAGVKRFEADPEVYQGKKPFPAELAWLGRTGTLRDQRYVEVHLAPVRYIPAIGGLEIHGTLEVTVHFEGGAAVKRPARDEPLFEKVYRSTLINAEQGKRFRVSATLAKNRPRAGDDGPAKAASGKAIPRKILVRDNAVVRIDYERMQGSGFLALPISSWALTNREQPVAVEIQDDGDDVLEPGEWIQFFGEALTDEPKTELNTDFADPFVDLYEARDFTDENVYFLSASGGAAILPTRDATPTFTRAPPPHFEAIEQLQTDNAYRPLGDADPWYWLPTLLATGGAENATRVDSVPLPGLYSATLPVRIQVHVRGSSEDPNVNPDHHTRVTVTNASADVLTTLDGAFDGRTLFLHDLDWTYPGSGPVISSPLQVQLDALDNDASRNDVILDFIEVRYRRAFNAIDDRLDFSWPDEDAEFIVDGLSSPDAAVYELRAEAGTPTVATRLTGVSASGSGPYILRFRIDEDPGIEDGAARRFLVVGPGAVAVPGDADFSADPTSDLRNPALQADMIIVAHPDLVDLQAGGVIQQFMDHKNARGITTKLALLPDVYDEFNDGLPGPLAIKNLVAWVLSEEGWAEPKPSYLLLIGDGSIDYKGGEAMGNFVPTQVMFKDDFQLGYYASDTLLANVVGDDQLADLVVGRFPSRSLAQTDMLLNKVIDYEQSPDLQGNWRSHALLISDRGNNAGEGNLDFELTNQRVQALICSEGESTNLGQSCPGDTPNSSLHLQYYTDYYTNPAEPTPADSMRQDIKNSVNGVDGVANGAAIVQYNGHGNFVVWSGDAFFDQRLPGLPVTDVEELTNAGRLPWVMAHNCLTGGFHLIQPNSMGEDWIHRPGGGGVGVLAPTGLSFNYVGETVSDLLWSSWYGRRKERSIAAPLLSVLTKLCTQGSIEPCQHYALLGDPSLELTLPRAEPASALATESFNARLELNWAPSPSPGATYDLYRAEVARPIFGGYDKLNTLPLSDTSYTDEDVVNARSYYYYVVATTPDGFRSAWSNFNEDCDLEGPDCVVGVPLNPDPPAVPTGLAVSDPGVGTQLRVTWAPNLETDLAYYTVHYGTEQGNLDQILNAGRATTVFVGGLTEGVTYYFALSATNTSTMTSALTDDVSDYPVFAPGMTPPRFIEDLTVTRSGNDLRLDWGAVVTDIYGKPLVPEVYEIFRAPAPAFGNDQLVKIGECAGACTSFVDPGAVLLTGNLQYRVRAVEGGGESGALGSELPDGTTLSIDRSELVPGQLVISWAPVTQTVDGERVELAHYAVYSAETPFSVEDVHAGLVPLLQTVQGTSLEVLAEGADRYYSVLAVDTRGNVSPF